MDSHRTGYNGELISFQSEKVNVVIKGKASHPLFEGIEYIEKDSSVKAFCLDDFSLYIKGSEYFAKNHNDSFQCALRCMPLFYEQQNYEIIIEANHDDHISFFHENYLIRNQIHPISTKSQILTGVINFDNNIGYSDFVILVNDQEYLRLTLEVFPTKISYKEDYQALVADINSELYSLVFDFMKKTYMSYTINYEKGNSPVEFFAIIHQIFQRFYKAAHYVTENPYHELEQNYEIKRADRIKKVDRQTISWLNKHPNHIRRGENGYRCDRALSVNKKITYDTKENRFVKFILKNTVHRLRQFEKHYLNVFKTPDEFVVNEIERMVHKVNHLVQNSFFTSVGDDQGTITSSLIFAMSSGYRELYKYFLMLQRGLSISGEVFSLSVKDTALLYEYWCFIKLNSILKKNYQLVSQDIIKKRSNGLYVNLCKGSSTSTVHYQNPRTGEDIILSYNPKKISLPTVTQKPDNVLRLEKKSGNVDYSYIFDAKYRIDPALKGTYYYQAIDQHPGPKVDDINTMHRYRDAIVSGKGKHPYERTMFGAYVLFPYGNEEEYKHHRFYKSIESVNVGGLPFLPSATHLVTSFLDDLITESEEMAFNRTTLPIGIENKLKSVKWNNQNVLIGLVKDQQTKDSCLESRSISIPANQINDAKLPVEYVAMYFPKSAFGQQAGVQYYGRVDPYMIDLKEEHRDHYIFYVDHWEKLKRKIEPKEQFHQILWTNEFLLKHARDVSELYFKSETEYRIYYEMRRYLEDIEINDFAHSFTFNHDLQSLVVDHDKIYLERQGNIEKILEVVDLKKRPISCMKTIKEFMERL